MSSSTSTSATAIGTQATKTNLANLSPDTISPNSNNTPAGNIAATTTTTTTKTTHNSINTAARINGSGQSYMGPPATPSVPVDENRKPKHLSQWTNADVIKWLKRHCEHFYEQYGELFLEHEITGRSLCKVTDNMLERMGLGLQEHRDELRRIIMKLKLKSDMVKLKDLERS